MAAVADLQLRIVENQGNAAALVSYELVSTQEDALEKRQYRELIELFGVDEGAGEDGLNELIPGGSSETTLNFESISGPDRKRIQLFALPTTAIDEDRNAAPSVVPLTDEIRARVTLTHIIQPVSVSSNVVRRG